MQISIENLGAVKKAEFELKPLTVFLGGNRQGKTQALYVATAFLENLEFGTAKYIAEYPSNKKLHFDEIDGLYSWFISNGNVSFDVVQFFNIYGQEYLNKLASLVPKYTSEIIGTKHVDYSKVKVSYVLSKKDIRTCSLALKKFEFEDRQAGLGLNIVKEAGSSEIFMYQTEKYSANVPATEIKERMLYSIVQCLHSSFEYLPLYFPSERLGISLLVQMFTQMNLGALMKAGDEGVFNFSSSTAYPYPVNQFLKLQLMYSVVHPDVFNNRNRFDKRRYTALSEVLTKEIVGDKVILKKTDADSFGEILAKVDGQEIDLAATSSGVKGLSSLVLYLQNIAERGQAIIIDEPELNLHPTLQAKFAEFITLLVNSGIKVAITTHSPYLVEHLQSLIQAYDLKDSSEVIEKLYLKNRRSLINKRKVGVYLFENGTSENILEEDGGINWQTFCDTANDIWNVTNTVYGLKLEEEEQNENETLSKRTENPEWSVAEDKPEYR